MSLRQFQMTAAARTRARLDLISPPPDALGFQAGEIIEAGLKIMGSPYGSRQELRQPKGLAEAGQVSNTVDKVPFSDINHAFDRLAQGTVQGRLGIDMQAAQPMRTGTQRPGTLQIALDSGQKSYPLSEAVTL